MKKLLTIFFIIVISFIISTNFILAAGTEDLPLGTDSGPVYKSLGTKPVKLTNPLTGNASSDTIPVYLGKIISYAMGIIGSLALVMFIYGGALWMLSAGNQEQVAKGKQVLIWAALGLAIIFTAYALVRFVIMAISGAAA